MICILDTSILCELLRVPNMSADHVACTEELREKIERRESLMIPMPAIFETGNHIGQNGAGQQRRKTAEAFVKFVEGAVAGEAPFTPTPFPEIQAVRSWLDVFPDWASRSDDKGKGSGLSDLVIQQEWERQRSLNPMRRVYIWSKDVHLSSYDTGPMD